MLEEQKFPGYGLWCSGASLRLGCIPEPGAGCEPTGVVLVPVSLSGCPGSSAGPTGLAGHRAGAWVLALGHLSRSWAPAGPRASVLGIGRRMVFPGISGNRNFLEGGRGGGRPGKTQYIQRSGRRGCGPCRRQPQTSAPACRHSWLFFGGVSHAEQESPCHPTASQARRMLCCRLPLGAHDKCSVLEPRDLQN